MPSEFHTHRDDSVSDPVVRSLDPPTTKRGIFPPQQMRSTPFQTDRRDSNSHCRRHGQTPFQPDLLHDFTPF